MKKIGIGYENYKEFIENDMYYIDKTLLIRDIVEKGGKVTLFTRPRRFGKTLALSILRTFFELEYDRDGNQIDKKRYFEGKKIMGASEKILSMMGRYPVVKLSLKSAKQPNFKVAFKALRDEIKNEFTRHEYVGDSDKLSAEERRMFRNLSMGIDDEEFLDREKYEFEIGRYATALKTLSACLKKYHNENVIILLDEYDVPLENAYCNGFYDEMVGFIRSLFESALKTNDDLQFAVVTGCLRISKEERIPEAKEWYDGYLFGETEIYNPWSITYYVFSIAINHMKFPQAFWANTSSNQIIKDMVWHANDEMKRELDVLIHGGTIEKQIHEDITYDDIHESEDNLWNFLFFTGYMKKVSERREGKYIYLTMKIPNAEIACIYESQIRGWFDKQVKNEDRSVLHKAVLGGDTDAIAGYVTNLLKKSISVFDSDESFYHGFFLSLLYGVPDYQPRSNREEGDGRPDIVLYLENPKDPAIIFEVKVRKKFNEMEEGLKEAYDQIGDKKYEEGVLEDGYLSVKSYGICFCKKSCIVGAYPYHGEE